MLRHLLLLLSFIFLSACATTTIQPAPNADSHIDDDGQRIAQTDQGVQLAAKLHEATVRPSPVENNYASFWIEVTNQRNVQLPLQYTDFLLLDDQGRQYQPVAPNDLVARLTDSLPYLIPYPYVGFYYLEDSIRAGADTQFRGEGSYHASRRPEYLLAEALPETSVLPDATVAGAIYFAVELRNLNSFRLRYQIGALPGQESFLLFLPFTVEKK